MIEKFENVINEINFNVGRLLKSHRKSNQIKTFKISITNDCFYSLKSRYSLSSRFKNVNEFINDFEILTERHYNDTDFISIVCDSFEINVSR
ncbi:hypothetical protein BpHYR1_004353, partial [Brachionus plicatilis]